MSATPDRPLVLVIDDETGSRESMAIALEKAGLTVRTFDDARKALEFLEENDSARLAICDLRMPHFDGLAFLNQVRERKYDLAVLLVTGYGSIESAVEAMRVGADDYLTKPIDLYELRKRAMNLIEKDQLRQEVTVLREQLDKRYGFESIIGRSEAMERLFEQMKLVAPTRSTVLIQGESGTGKELVANALHRVSPRRNERFLAINCGAIPSDILESELFGHERGSFTGAVARKIGKFELAHRGTLFLDEISELYPELQVKLLRVLEERRVMRVGASELIDVDFRLIAATNRDLEKEIAEGRFREDLYYRLKVVTLRIPPLRERPTDIPLLIEHYLKAFAQEHGKEAQRVAPEALELLIRYPWPGNVRQLKNAVESMVIFSGGPTIGVRDLPTEVREFSGVAAPPPPPIPSSGASSGFSPGLSPGFSGSAAAANGSGEPSYEPVAALSAPPSPLAGGPKTMADIERQAILETLEKTGGHRARAADLLGIGLRTLQRKLKEYKDEGYFHED